MDFVEESTKGAFKAVEGTADTSKHALKFLSGATKAGCFFWLGELVYTKFWGYLYDLIAMKIPATKRYKELSCEQLVCRFCGNTIPLLGAWKCECGFSRPGNYFGRCPNCGRYPRFIDCPACRFTMDVR